MKPIDLYHLGVVVAQLEKGMDHFTELLGLRWTPISEVETTVHRPTGEIEVVDLRLTISADAPHIELIEAVPGSVWELNPYSNIHHIGFWSPDVPGDSQRLHGGGCPLEVMGYGGDRPRWAYHRDDWGVRTEVLDVGVRPAMQASWDAVPSPSDG